MRSASPLVRERDDDAQAAADEARELVLGLGEAARGDRGPLRLERERLAGRERVELDRARQDDGRRAPPPPRPRAPRPAARRGRAAGTGGTRSVGTGPGARRRRRSDVVEVEPPLGRRVDRDLVDRMQRALRERRERADALDLVAEELDAERLAAGRREDVDDAAADGELAALLDAARRARSRRARASRPARRCRARRPARSRIGSGRAAGGGMPSASAGAEAQTSPPAARTSSARARSPTRCGGGSRPELQLTPRLGRSATRSSPRNQPAASAASRASASSGASTTSGRPSSS